MSPAGTITPSWNDGNNLTSTNFAASSGSPAGTGGRYNWGKTGDADRSIGFISSQTYSSPNSIMAWYRNNGNDQIDALTISYDLFQFRINTAAPTVSFFYSTDGSIWTEVTFGDAQLITTGASSYNFSDPANFGRSVAAGSSAFTIKGLAIPVGGNIYLRWEFKTIGSSSSEGLGLDNVQLTANFGAIATLNGVTSSARIKESFDGIGLAAAATLPSNWKMSPPASLTPSWDDPNNFTNTTFAASSGTPVTGGKYNWGQANDTDRAIGFISSQSYLSQNSIMAWYANADTQNLTSLTISYDLYQFRINTAQPIVSFYYSIDGLNWTPFSAGDAQPITTGPSAYNFLNPPNFGRSVAAGTSAFTVTDVNVPPGGNVYLRWNFKTVGSSSSEGLGLDNVEIIGGTGPAITRGPYLNIATQNGITIRWRTNIPTASRVKFGLSPDNLSDSISDATITKEHIIQLTGLAPNTEYYYSVGSSNEVLQGDGDNYFKTLPITGSTQKVRILAMGDMGTNSNTQVNVRNAYLNYNGSNYTNVWLLVGDNAYESGLDSEYQTNFFNIYQGSLTKNHVLWPSPGNHDYASNTTLAEGTDVPYYSIFSTPVNGEAGGVPSGSKTYYSYDYGNIHFISLQSFADESSNTALFDTTSPQAEWLKQDLAANTQKWTVVYFHYPPYSKGGSNSDTDPIDFRIRNKIVPILERYKVDLVITGHSHDYERTFLINGHYGLSNTFDTATMAISSSSGKYDGSPNSTPYIKNSTDARNGIVYALTGSSGQTTGATSSGYPHHAMQYSNITDPGCMVIEIEDNRLDAKWICSDGIIRDNFTIMKDVNKITDTTGASGSPITLTASWIGNYVWSNGETTRSITVNPSSDTSYIVGDGFNALKDSFHVIVTNQLVASVTAGTINCNGSTTTVTVTATGGAAPYSGTGDFTVSAGTYNYTITDANGNTATATITVDEPAALAVSFDADSILCNGGTITVAINATGGTAPYTGEGNFTVAAGSYNYIITDANGCTVDTTIIINQPDNISVSSTSTIASECSDNGTITLNATGGTSPFTYSLDGINFVATNNFTDLASGTYTGYVKDATCPDIISVSGIIVGKADDIVVSASSVVASECNDDGSITITRNSGGVSPFSYSLDGVSFVSSNKFKGLAFGTYTAYIKDANCPAIPIPGITINKASSIVITAVNVNASECSDDGSITLNKKGGVGPFTYSLDGVNFVSTNKFTGLAAGTYTGYVKDARCPVVSLDNIIIGKTADIVVTAAKTNASECSDDGTITLKKTGGAGPFTYSLDGINFVSTNKFTGLAAGTYTGYVKDAKCPAVSLDNIVVGKTSDIIATFSKTSASACNDDGTITLTRKSGGISPFTYSIDGVNFVSTNKFTGVAADTYTGYIKDARCAAIEIPNIVVSKAAGIIVKASKTNATNCSNIDGSITLSRTGGTSPFAYSLTDGNYASSNIFPNLPHGTYSGWVQDARGCKGTLNGIIVGPANCASLAENSGSGKELSLKTVSQTLKINAFPNPTLKEFTLKIESNSKENIRIVITDMYGKKVFETEGGIDQAYTCGSDFSSGLYIVQVIQGKNIQTLKLIKGK
jgi:guanyl-specific ribonuclease Sa